MSGGSPWSISQQLLPFFTPLFEDHHECGVVPSSLIPMEFRLKRTEIQRDQIEEGATPSRQVKCTIVALRNGLRICPPNQRQPFSLCRMHLPCFVSACTRSVDGLERCQGGRRERKPRKNKEINWFSTFPHFHPFWKFTPLSLIRHLWDHTLCLSHTAGF